MPRRALSQPRTGFRLGHGVGLNVPQHHQVSALGRVSALPLHGSQWGRGGSPLLSPCSPVLSGLSLAQLLAQPLVQPVEPLLGNGGRLQTEANWCAGELWGPQGVPWGGGRMGQLGRHQGLDGAWEELGSDPGETRGAVAVPQHPSCLPGPEGGFFPRAPFPLL